MDYKKVGLIALAVVVAAVLAWSFRNNFMNEPAPAGQDRAAIMRNVMTKQSAAPAPGRGGHSAAPAAPESK